MSKHRFSARRPFRQLHVLEAIHAAEVRPGQLVTVPEIWTVFRRRNPGADRDFFDKALLRLYDARIIDMKISDDQRRAGGIWREGRGNLYFVLST